MTTPQLENSLKPRTSNPNVEAVLADVSRWMTARFKAVTWPPHIKPKVFVETAVRLAAKAAPRARYQGIRLLSQICLWLYVIDAPADNEVDAEHIPDFASAFGDARAVLDNPQRPAHNPFAVALRDIAIDLQLVMTQGQFDHWRAAVRGYLDGVETEQVYRRDYRMPSLAEYAAMRRHTSGVPVVLAMAEAVDGIVVPESAWNDDLVQFTHWAVEVIAYDNDIFSRPREAAEAAAVATDGTPEPVILNLIDVLAAMYGTTIPEATTRASEMRDQSEANFRRALGDFRANTNNPNVLAYVEAVCRWVYGHLQFAQTSERYTS